MYTGSETPRARYSVPHKAVRGEPAAEARIGSAPGGQALQVLAGLEPVSEVSDFS